MTPEEKANEIVNEFYAVTEQPNDEGMLTAIQCAIIHVMNTIITIVEIEKEIVQITNSDYNSEAKVFYKQVLEELNKL